MQKFILYVLIIVLSSLNLYSQPSLRLNSPLDIVDYDLSKDSLDKSTIKKILRKKEFWEPRVTKSGKFLNSDVFNEEIQKFKKNKNTNTQSNYQWKALGPAPEKSNSKMMGTGRLNCVRFHNSNSSQIWVGSATSGLWVSNNKGDFWEQVNLGDYPILGISDIVFPVSNHNYIYVATGDCDGEGGFGAYSIGIMLSKDNGKTWEFLYRTTRLETKFLISRLIVNPENENELFAATSKGLMYFNNSKMVNLDSNAFFRDLEMKPGDFNILYANRITNNNSYISKSTDKGITWQNIDTLGGYSRAQISTTYANPNKIIALVSDNVARQLKKLIVSNDEGNNWIDLIGLKLPKEGQCFYNMTLAVSPYFENEIYFGCINNYTIKADSAYFSSKYIHPDTHDIIYSPHSNEIYFANDGGVYKQIIGKDSIYNISNNLNITQFYGMKAPKDNDNIIYAGSQDNGGLKFTGKNWIFIDGGDVLDYQVDNLYSQVYYTFKNFHMIRRSNGGNSIYTKPFMQGQRVIFPNLMYNDTILYFGLNRIIKTIDKGRTLIEVTDSIETIVSFDIDEKNSNNIIIACKTKNSGSKIYQSIDGGKTLKILYENPNHIPNAIKFIDPISNRFLVTFAYSDSSTKVLEFQNNEIKNVTFDMPNVSINCIEIDKTQNNIFIGTDIGVFSSPISAFGIYNWQIINNNMPYLIIKELELHKGSGKLRVATYGMGIWETQLYTCNIEKPILNFKDTVIYCPYENVYVEVLNYDSNYIYKWSLGVFGKSVYLNSDIHIIRGLNISYIYVTAFSKFDNCIASSNLVYIKEYYTPSVSLNGIYSKFLCEGESKVVTAIPNIENFNLNYLWNDGSTSNTFLINKPGKYNLKYFFGNDGCNGQIDFELFENLDKRTPKILFENYTIKISNDFKYPKWYFEGKEINIIWKDSISIFNLEFLGNGSYYCTSYDSNGCIKKSNILEINLNLDEIIISPSEADNFIKVNKFFKEKTDFNVNVVDILGKEIFIGNFSANGLFETQINLNNIASGKYYLVLKNSKMSLQNSFIKK